MTGRKTLLQSILATLTIGLAPYVSLGQSIAAPPAPIARRYTLRDGSDRSNRMFWVGVIVLSAAKGTDALTTRRMLDRGNIETDRAFGTHPSNGRLVGVNLAYLAGEVGGYWLTEHSWHKWVRWAGRATIGYCSVDHALLAYRNSQLGNRGEGGVHARRLPPLLPHVHDIP